MKNSDTDTKTAADSTPAAVPPGSLPDKEQGADTGELEITTADIAAVLNPRSDGQPANPDDESDSPEPATPENEDTPPAEPASEEETETAEESQSAETPPSGEEDEDPDSPTEPEAKPKTGLQSRIDELTAEKKTAQSEVARLREQVAAMGAANTGSYQPATLEGIDSRADLTAYRQKQLQLHQWALANQDGATLKGADGNEVEYDRDQIAQIRAETFGILNDALPTREQYLTQREQLDQSAYESYPWLKDTAKGDGAAVQQAIEAIPQLRSNPAYRLIAANAYTGEKLRRAGITVDDALIEQLKARQQQDTSSAKAKPSTSPAKSAVAPKPPQRAPSAPGRAGVVPPRSSSNSDQRTAVERMKRSHGSEDDLTLSIASKL